MSNIDIAVARHNMIEQQIRPWEVLDPDALALLEEVSRDAFVPEAYRNIAFSDTELPIGEGQTMLPPRIEAHILQALAVNKGEHVLVVGTGSGYLTALLAKRAASVVSVEIHESLSNAAAERLAAADIKNVKLVVGDASQGWSEDGPYDAIAITGSLPELPVAFEQSLKPGGRLFAVVGSGAAMVASITTRVDESHWQRDDVLDTSIAPLENIESEQVFVL